MKLLIKYILTIVFFFSINISSQEFYISTYELIPPFSYPNKIVQCNVANSNEVNQSYCPPTINSFDLYSDIAVDTNNNFYYVTSDGSLYKRNANNSSCDFLGTFPGGANALTADNGNFIYAAGSNYVNRYDINSGTFTTMGQLPIGYSSSGDLFFYENKLFLTTTLGLLEINMINPSQSCLFMSLNGIISFAAFSTKDENNSKAYLISNAAPNSLYEIDMVNKQLGNPIRTFSYDVLGAAAPYPLTSTNAACTPTLKTHENNVEKDYLTIINPVKKHIAYRTNLSNQDILSVRLFDNSGRLIKEFPNSNKLEKFDISGIAPGNYLFSITTKNGKTLTKKIIIQG